jgi:hypothetical protein
MITQYIPDLVGEVVAKTAMALQKEVYYDWGHYSEVVKNLDEKDKSITNKAKYPLIWLVLDTDEQMGRPSGVYAELSLQFIIATDTSANYTMQERRDNSFLPVLYPIYSELLNQFSRSSDFGMPARIEHTKTDRPYWGVQGGIGNGSANLFNDFIDAIQLKNFKVNVKRKLC